ncbi:hypothetical protein Patl1_30024 [Pistacia atlantica]|uniref:Uncharacterized protein n=1 Tax=Pistacia atlantica TaxID=434234 RepID=A0ACC1AEC2_9ROSI|nr:hypothetical protein Patl1_30024 [Pistacia atlantica]
MSSTFKAMKPLISLASSALLLPSSSPVWELHINSEKWSKCGGDEAGIGVECWCLYEYGVRIVGDAAVRAQGEEPSLDKKYAMEPEEVGHELLLYSRLSSSPVEIPENVSLEPTKKGRCWNELKSRGMLKWGKRKKV